MIFMHIATIYIYIYIYIYPFVTNKQYCDSFEYRHPNFPGVTYELEVVLSDGEVTSKFRHGSGTGGSGGY